ATPPPEQEADTARAGPQNRPLFRASSRPATPPANGSWADIDVNRHENSITDGKDSRWACRPTGGNSRRRQPCPARRGRRYRLPHGPAWCLVAGGCCPEQIALRPVTERLSPSPPGRRSSARTIQFDTNRKMLTWKMLTLIAAKERNQDNERPA